MRVHAPQVRGSIPRPLILLRTTHKPAADMVKVKIVVSMAGSGFVWEPGQVVAVPADEAERLIAAGFATKAPGKAKVDNDPPAE